MSYRLILSPGLWLNTLYFKFKTLTNCYNNKHFKLSGLHYCKIQLWSTWYIKHSSLERKIYFHLKKTKFKLHYSVFSKCSNSMFWSNVKMKLIQALDNFLVINKRKFSLVPWTFTSFLDKNFNWIFFTWWPITTCKKSCKRRPENRWDLLCILKLREHCKCLYLEALIHESHKALLKY